MIWESTESWYGRVEETFGSKLPRITEGIILDLGCSQGATTSELCRLYPKTRVIGIDLNFDRLINSPYIEPDNLSNREKRDFLVADGYRLPFREGTFDAVFCMNNLAHLLTEEHFLNPDYNEEKNIILRQFLNISKTIKRGGYFLISAD